MNIGIGKRRGDWIIINYVFQKSQRVAQVQTLSMLTEGNVMSIFK